LSESQDSFILTKLDGTAQGGAWYAQFPDLNSLALSVSGLEDLQPFDLEAFVEAIFPKKEARASVHGN
jgi:fused signal recognition particle receptor